MNRTTRTLLALFLVLPVALVAYAQGDQLRPELIDVEADDTPQVGDQQFPLVELDVAVLNEFNVPVRGLTAADFTLIEDELPVDFAVTPLDDTGQPVSVLLLLDISGPMFDQLVPLRQASIMLYDSLEQTDESALIAFAATADGTAVDLETTPLQFAPGREHPFTNDEGALINHINALQMEENSGTPLYDALYKAIRLSTEQANSSARAVILITGSSDLASDGAGPGSRFVNADLAIEEARQARIPLFTVSWANAADNDYLQRAANFTGGAFYQVFEPAQISSVYNEIIGTLRQRYRLQYQSGLPADGRRHLLTLALPNSVSPGQAQVEFVARPPEIPQVTDIAVLPARAETAVSLSDATLQGLVSLTPQIVSRNAPAAVNYYLDDEQVAIFAAAQAPWTFLWDTSNLSPGTHTLIVEVIDGTEPPHVGLFETTVQVAGCDLLCRGQQLLGFNPLFLVAGALVLAFAALAIVWNARAPRPAEPALPAPQPQRRAAPPRPQPAPLQPRAPMPQEPPPRERPQASSSTLPTTTPAAGRQDKTEVLRPEPRRLAFLIDVLSGQAHRLGANTRLGTAADNDIIIEDPEVRAHFAVIQLSGDHYLLQVTPPGMVQVNGTNRQHHSLADGDRLQFGSRLFQVKVIK